MCELGRGDDRGNTCDALTQTNAATTIPPRTMAAGTMAGLRLMRFVRRPRSATAPVNEPEMSSPRPRPQGEGSLGRSIDVVFRCGPFASGANSDGSCRGLLQRTSIGPSSCLRGGPSNLCRIEVEEADDQVEAKWPRAPTPRGLTSWRAPPTQRSVQAVRTENQMNESTNTVGAPAPSDSAREVHHPTTGRPTACELGLSGLAAPSVPSSERSSGSHHMCSITSV